MANQNQTQKKIIDAVESWKSTPYLYGGDSNKGIDCSHFVLRVFRAAVDSAFIYGTASQLQNSNRFVTVSIPKNGDLVFWKGHVAIVIDAASGKFAGAQSSTGVAVANYKTGYWAGSCGGCKPLAFRRYHSLQ